jgi:NAD(P)-dependent dehydrogenase (short-subunit alcohol dehydrogenase family)
MRLKDKVAVVTGGGGGLGEGIALCFAKEGADVVISDVNMELAEKVAAGVRKEGRRALAIKTDVRIPAQVDELISKTLDEMGGIDILTCSHGVSGMTHREHAEDEVPTLESITEEDWDLTLDVNLKGVFLCNKAVTPHFKEKGRGKIINVSSVGGRKGSPQLFAYSISKAGVIALSQALALQLAPYSINVNTICPGIIYTPMWQEGAKLMAKMDPRFKDLDITPKATLDFMVEMAIPFKRMQTPEDIGNTAVFLASDEASEITGQAINVCGGMHFS